MRWQTGPAGTGYIVEAASEAISLPMVLPNGDLGVVAEDNLEAQVASIARIRIDIAPGAGSVATGGAIVFSAQHQIAIQQLNFPRQLADADYSIAAAVDENTDSGAPNGRIYVVWGDRSLRTDSTNDVFLSRSEDAGITWSAPLRVNGGPTNDDVNHLAAAPAVLVDGTVVVGYRQRQESAASNGAGSSLNVDTLVQTSTDHAATFGEPLKIKSITDDLGYAAVSHGAPFLGDYQEMAAAGDCAYIARAEPLQLSTSEAEQIPPVVHHQRIFVGLVGGADCTLSGSALPEIRWVPWLAVLGSVAVGCYGVRRRRRATV